MHCLWLLLAVLSTCTTIRSAAVGQREIYEEGPNDRRPVVDFAADPSEPDAVQLDQSSEGKKNFVGIEIWQSATTNSIAIRPAGTWTEERATAKYPFPPLLACNASEFAKHLSALGLDFGQAPLPVTVDYVIEKGRLWEGHMMSSVGSRQFDHAGAISDRLDSVDADGALVIQPGHAAYKLQSRWSLYEQYPRCQLQRLDATLFAETAFPVYKRYYERDWKGKGLEPGFNCIDFANDMTQAMCHSPVAEPYAQPMDWQLWYRVLNLYNRVFYVTFDPICVSTDGDYQLLWRPIRIGHHHLKQWLIAEA